MFSSSAFASAGVGIEKKFYSSCEKRNPDFLEHCQKLLLLSLLPGQSSFGLFQELQNTVACQCCHKQSFFAFENIEKERKKKEKECLSKSDEDESPSEYYCVICYVDRFCNVFTFQNHDGSEIHYIFKEKGSSGSILYQSSSKIQRFSASE
jgi:hypothetical protein